jgi:hypothetical protein
MKIIVQMAIMFSLIALNVLPASAVGIIVGNATGQAGDTVSIDVTLDTVPGYVAGYGPVLIKYDPARLSFVVCDSTLSGLYLDTPGIVTFGGLASDGGVILTCRFTIEPSNNLPRSMALTITESEIVDVNGALIIPTVVNGSITDISPQLSVAMSGSGGGTVTSNPSSTPGIACTSGNCVTFYPSGTKLSLLQKPDATSTFDKWTGCNDIGSEGECNVTMTGAKNISASFAAAPKAKVVEKPFFVSVQEAYDDSATVNNAVIKLLDDTLIGNFTAARNITVTLEGGYNAAYTGISAETVIKGAVVLKNGTVKMKGIVVR